MDCFLWTEKSQARNELTRKFEPIQPYLFLSFLEFANAEIVIDVGANVGFYSLLSTLFVNIEAVHAFEPDEAAYNELVKNFKLNGVEFIANAYNSAISNVVGSVHFGSHSPMSGVNGILDTSIHDPIIFSETKSVNTTTLDQMCTINNKVLGVKIDIEGHEFNAIVGGENLLGKNPAIIQVENYNGSGVNEKLKELGYCCFFVAGHDFYFTNIKNFYDPLFVKRAVEHAATLLVESSSGRLLNLNAIKNCLSVSCEILDNIAYVKVALNEGFFYEDVEYAFYLLMDGVKVEEKWYQDTSETEFLIDNAADMVEVRAFAREKNNPDKKVMASEFIKKPIAAYRAMSAVPESWGIPSFYAKKAHSFYAENISFSELDYSSFFRDIEKILPTSILQLGGGGAFEVEEILKKNRQGYLYVLCTECEYFLLKEARAFKADLDIYLSRYMLMKQVSDSKDLLSFFASNSIQLSSIKIVLIRGQFLENIGSNLKVLSNFFEGLPSGSKIYTEALSNASYKNVLSELAFRYSLEVQWLYPRSTIMPPNELCLAKSEDSSANSKLSRKVNCNLPLSSQTSQAIEVALGLDFSLPEDAPKH